MSYLQGFLTIRPGAMTFTDWPLPTLEIREHFVGGHLERLELAEGIDIWINEKQYEKASVDNLSLVIQNGEKKRPIFGNAFFATTDNLGNCISMNNEQVDWLRAHLLTGVKNEAEFYKIIDVNAAPRANVGVRS